MQSFLLQRKVQRKVVSEDNLKEMKKWPGPPGEELEMGVLDTAMRVFYELAVRTLDQGIEVAYGAPLK